MVGFRNPKCFPDVAGPALGTKLPGTSPATSVSRPFPVALLPLCLSPVSPPPALYRSDLSSLSIILLFGARVNKLESYGQNDLFQGPGLQEWETDFLFTTGDPQIPLEDPSAWLVKG